MQYEQLSGKVHERASPMPDWGQFRTCAAHKLRSALGQKQTCAVQKVMSALPPKADMCMH